MCHFYANPLSALTDNTVADVVYGDILEAVRNTMSFRRYVDRLLDTEEPSSVEEARALLEQDEVLRGRIYQSAVERDSWIDKTLRALAILEATGAQVGTFSESYVNALEYGITAEDGSTLATKVQRLEAEEIAALIQRVASIFDEDEQSLGLEPSTSEEDQALRDALMVQGGALDRLRSAATEQDVSLRSKYSGQSRVMRTTVIAQRVQLSRDSAALSDEDKQFTDVIDEVVKLLVGYLTTSSANVIFLSEAWLYDSRAPLRDVLVPRPQVIFKRCLTRPHDYLGCACCKSSDAAGGIQPTLPSTSILYQMYLETGNLINVADLWSAFYALVESEETGGDERSALAAFYQGMAELRALGFVKPSKKKADHVAKVKWL